MDDITKFYKDRYEECSEVAARLTGMIEAFARYYPSEISPKMQVKILNGLIEVYQKKVKSDDHTAKWVSIWQAEIDKINSTLAVGSAK